MCGCDLSRLANRGDRRSSSGNLAMLTAVRCGFVGRQHQVRRRTSTRLILEIDVLSKRVAVAIVHDEAGLVVVLDGPRRREAATLSLRRGFPIRDSTGQSPL
jgi:hypothetical protein